MIAILIFLAAAQQAMPVPPPTAQNTAECRHPTYATDILICGDPALRLLDQRMVEALAGLSEERMMSPWIEGQRDWFRRSRLCAFKADHHGCVSAAYAERLTVLSMLASSPSPTGPCDLSKGGSALVAEEQGGGVLLIDGRVAAIGFYPESGWQPFIRYDRNGQRAIFRTMEGKKIARCRLKR